jgi:hypothetical protein
MLGKRCGFKGRVRLADSFAGATHERFDVYRPWDFDQAGEITVLRFSDSRIFCFTIIVYLLIRSSEPAMMSQDRETRISAEIGATT